MRYFYILLCKIEKASLRKKRKRLISYLTAQILLDSILWRESILKILKSFVHGSINHISMGRLAKIWSTVRGICFLGCSRGRRGGLVIIRSKIIWGRRKQHRNLRGIELRWIPQFMFIRMWWILRMSLNWFIGRGRRVLCGRGIITD